MITSMFTDWIDGPTPDDQSDRRVNSRLEMRLAASGALLNWLQGKDLNFRPCGYEPHALTRLRHPAKLFRGAILF